MTFLPSNATCAKVLLVALCWLAASNLQAGGIRPQDEIFEINTRPACCTTDAQRLACAIEVRQYVATDASGCRQWVMSDLASVTQGTSAATPTIVYVHGNKVNLCDARRRSLDVYRALARCACDERPIRFVIWSWPAAEVKGLLNDFRVKAARTRPVGWQLAWWLDQLPPDATIGLFGYSYGSRVIGGATHLVGGGDLNGLALPTHTGIERRPYRVAHLAAATHAHWLGTNQYHGCAFHQIDRLLLVNNCKDPAMRYYKLVEQNSKPQAMGLKGPTCLPIEARGRVQCLDATQCVGRTHYLYDYLSLHRTMGKIWCHLTFANSQ